MTRDRKDFDGVTKFLHIGMSLVLTIQMVVGLFVHDPHTWLFLYAHQYIGILSVVILLAEWLWIYAAAQAGVLFPWNKGGMHKVFFDMKRLANRSLPESGQVTGLSGFWHGLGLLCFSALAVSGVVILFVLPGHHSVLGVRSHDFALYTDMAVTHRWLSYFAWIYLAGHVSMAIAHEVAGNDLLGRMFLFRKG